MTLIKYDTQAIVELKTIPSGVKSPDSTSEMMIVKPIVKHPELEGLVKAIDPITKWEGWVKYEEPIVITPAAEPTQEETDKLNIEYLLDKLRLKAELVNLGVVTEEETDIKSLRTQIKALL